jgi:hypothetical protein
LGSSRCADSPRRFGTRSAAALAAEAAIGGAIATIIAAAKLLDLCSASPIHALDGSPLVALLVAGTLRGGEEGRLQRKAVGHGHLIGLINNSDIAIAGPGFSDF